jgi:photosystem II stability/assembly factor-like uncharacterized protein
MLFKSTKLILIFAILFSSIINLQSQIFWNEVNSGVTAALRSVSNANAMVAWVCGANGTVIKTTNGGYNWTNHTGNGIPANITLINIFGIDNNNAITAGYTGTNTFVYRTYTGGNNWVQVFTEANGFINGIWMKNEYDGIMIGDPVGGRWSIWYTYEGGGIWDSTGMYLPQVGSEAGWNNSLFSDSNKVWFGTNNNRIYYSTDFGSSWNVQNTSPEINTYSVSFQGPAEQYGLAGGTTLLLTSNSGQNWQTISAPGSGIFNGTILSYAYATIAWYIRSSNNIYYSFPPFTNWNVGYTAPAGTYNHISLSRATYAYGPGMIFAVRSNGGISRGNFTFEGVRILSNEIPASFKLSQNYPNPFNPVTKIKLEIPHLKNNSAGEVRGSLIQIKIYNSLGQEVETVLDQITQPGIYEAEWNGSNYPSGVYYYQVIIKDPKFVNSAPEQRETKKMVLIK